MKIYIASDHAGFSLKNQLVAELTAEGHTIIDEGTHSDASTNYALYAHKVCAHLNADENVTTFGILICGTGIGMSMAANRHPHIRAALCQTPFEASLSRMHNNANVLCLGARIISADSAIASVKAFLIATFEGGRHAERLQTLTP